MSLQCLLYGLVAPGAFLLAQGHSGFSPAATAGEASPLLVPTKLAGRDAINQPFEVWQGISLSVLIWSLVCVMA